MSAASLPWLPRPYQLSSGAKEQWPAELVLLWYEPDGVLRTRMLDPTHVPGVPDAGSDRAALLALAERHALSTLAALGPTGMPVPRFVIITQPGFLSQAIVHLALKPKHKTEQLARLINMPDRTVEKWLFPTSSKNYRTMPGVAWTAIADLVKASIDHRGI